MTKDLSIREKWLLMLAKLCSPAYPDQASEALSAFLPFLTDLPDEAFTRRSLETVVAAKRRQPVPALDELRIPLLTWWRDNHAHAPRIGSARPSLTPADYSWVRYWQTRMREGFVAYGESPGGKRHVASLIRQQSPAAWAHIAAEGMA